MPYKRAPSATGYVWPAPIVEEARTFWRASPYPRWPNRGLFDKDTPFYQGLLKKHSKQFSDRKDGEAILPKFR